MSAVFRLIASCIILALIVSCSYSGTKQSDSGRTLPKTGVIHEKILYEGYPEKSYALYIPAGPAPLPSPKTGRGKISQHLFPVIIAFDPHGNGVLPLTLYKNLAEKYGFILVGSNDSRNGLQAEEVRGIVTAMVHEVRVGYPIDTNRMYLLGFSGGARVATMAAMYQVPVKGVIACGAGLGGAEQPMLYKFDYFGIAGTSDFNMNEMLQLDEPLSRAAIRHFITTFPGIHAWPPADVMEDGFLWITLNAMKDGVVEKDNAFLSAVFTTLGNRIKTLKKSGNLISAADAYHEEISFAEGLIPADHFREELSALEKQSDYQMQVAYRFKILKKEEEEKQELMQALQAKDLGWWKVKIKSYDLRFTINDSRHASTNPEDTLKNRRLMAFLSLFCYMNANAAITRQNESAAIKIIAIYEMADAANPEPNYMRAVLLARRSENEAAFGQLKIAIAKGFTDKDRLTRQTEFQEMSSSPSWFDLLKKIK